MPRKPTRARGPLAGDARAEALAVQLAALSRMDAAALRVEWQHLYRAPPPPKLGRDLLELAVAWALQERALGGLDAPARRQLAGLADLVADGSALPQARQVNLKPGARIVRRWGGQTHEVVVVDGGFLWQERVWRSLSVIAREMTGTRWSGPRFFGLDRTATSGRSSVLRDGASAGA